MTTLLTCDDDRRVGKGASKSVRCWFESLPVGADRSVGAAVGSPPSVLFYNE